MNALATTIAQLELQTMLYNNCVDGWNDADAAKRPGQANHVKWIAGHLVSTRYMMANLLGLGVQEPFPALFENGKGRQEDATYPSMAELTKDWNGISAKVINKLKSMSDAELNAAAPFPTPAGDGTLKGTFGFFAHHEAYSIGQLGYARRIAGMEAMKYEPKKEAATA
jgi:DinB superfamily